VDAFEIYNLRRLLRFGGALNSFGLLDVVVVVEETLEDWKGCWKNSASMGSVGFSFRSRKMLKGESAAEVVSGFS